MGKKLGLTLTDVVDAAVTIADRDGLEAASLSAVAEQLGIKTPSMYNHVAGLHGLRRAMALRAASMLAEVFEEAARDSDDPERAIRQIAHAYRGYVKTHPGLYRTLSPAPKPGEDDELYEAMAAPVGVVLGILTSFGVDAEYGIHVIRAWRAMMHGFVDLETSGGFGMPTDIDTSFELGVDALILGVLGGKR